jgi:hypothetical protein
MKNAILLIAVLISSLLLHAQPEVLTGKIGAYPVIMELDAGNEEITGNYFYVKYRKNTALMGLKKSGGIISVATSQRQSDKADAEVFELTNAGSSYAGSWALDKKRLRVELKPINLEQYKNPYDELEFVKKLKKDNPYHYVLISAFVFSKDSSTSVGGYIVDWYKEKYTHVPMLQLRNDSNNPAIAKINNALKENTLEECIMESTCGESTKEYDYSATVQAVFAGADVFSVNLCSSYYCGGAYPDAGCVGLSWDLKTGASLDLKDVIWFGQQIPADNDEEAWQIYKDSVFAPSVVKLYQSLYPADMKDVGGDCGYTESFNWGTVNWYFTKKGLYLGPVYPHYGMACSTPEWSVIPYNVLKKYRSPKNVIKLPGD